MESFIEAYLEDNRRLLTTIDSAAMARVITTIKIARDEEKRFYAIGNGGSASTASHFVNDMGKGASVGREKRFKTIPLTDNVEWMTALSNDLSYDDVYVEQLKNFAEAGDVLLAISGSGNSENVLKAVSYANSVDCHTIGFTGFGGGKLKDLANESIVIDSSHMGRVEDLHLILQHMICYWFMETES